MPGLREPQGVAHVEQAVSVWRVRIRSVVTAGTIFQDTRKPFNLWFQAIWWVVGHKNGATAVGLNRVLGIGSEKTAWTWLHKLRRAMVRPGREPLTGEVEVDETFVGGVEKGGGRRHLGNKAMVVIAAEIRGKGIGRIRLKRIADGSSDSLTTFVREAVEKGGVIVSDGLQSYRSLPEHGYQHTRRIGEGRTKASTLLPRVHRVASLLKRWLLGTHQGAVSREHLVLPGRIRLSLQSTHLAAPRESSSTAWSSKRSPSALLPTRPSSSMCEAGRAQRTTGRGHSSQGPHWGKVKDDPQERHHGPRTEHSPREFDVVTLQKRQPVNSLLVQWPTPIGHTVSPMSQSSLLLPS